LYCDLETRVVFSPLHCSVNKSASLGYPWKEDDPKLRRAKQDLNGKTKPFNPRRTAAEMHSSWLPEFKKQNPEYLIVSADVYQQALRNVDQSFQNFFTKKSGFPKFKKHKDVAFEYKPKTVKINKNHITFPVIGTMRFFKSRDLTGSWEIRTVTVSRQADGWYVSILLRDETVPDIILKTIDECETIQGVDVGIKKIAALSSGDIITNPQFLKKSERKLEIAQRRVSRKKKGSRNRKKAAERVARIHQKIARQRNDFQWKTGKQIAGGADITAFEDLNITGMKAHCKPKKDEVTGKYLENGQAAKSGLNKSISDASWYSLRKKTEHQAAKLGNIVILVDPKFTSLECPVCHQIDKNNRDKEKFLCGQCGHADDADINGSVNIAQRGLNKLGNDSLLVVSQKVTPKEPARQEASSATRDEPRNPAKSTVKQRQLRLLTVKSVPVQTTPKGKRKRKTQVSQHTQLDLFDGFDWDALESTS
jgi:putative transposase